MTKRGFTTPDRCLMTGFLGHDPIPSFAEDLIDLTPAEGGACEDLMVLIAEDAGVACTVWPAVRVNEFETPDRRI